ncbi:MAG: 3'-5' exonuclease [Thermostichales cyanobacterium SZTDM-1c_bins_54]
MDRQTAHRLALDLLNNPLAVILDTETTDLNGYIIELAVLSMQGVTLYNRRFNPLAPISPQASRVHGLQAQDLEHLPTFGDEAEQIRSLLQGKLLCAYNASFDRQILENECRRLGQDWQLSWQCLMQPYAAWVGDWDWQRRDYRWPKLPGGNHSALGDCQAALKVLRQMASPPPGFSAP